MSNEVLGLGTKVMHSTYGTGIVVEVNIDSYLIYFKHRGEETVHMNDERTEVLNFLPVDGDRVSIDDVETALNNVLEKWNAQQDIIPLGDKWQRGTLIMQPANPDLKPYELPVEKFFHKIVMLRDRIRVMEQKINSSNLSSTEKVDLQQYVTRIYGSLTSFNILFKHKHQQFKGQGRKIEGMDDSSESSEE